MNSFSLSAKAIPSSRSHRTAIVVGSGFGGAVAAYRLSHLGIDTLVLERGRNFGRSEDEKIFASEADLINPLAVWSPQLIGTTGALEVTGYGSLVSVTGVGLGGGSLVYAGATVPPVEKYYEKVFPSEISYQEMSSLYWPRVMKNIQAEYLPSDLYHSNLYKHVREFDADFAAAGFKPTALATSFDFSVVRKEILGEVRPSAIVGESHFGNSNGAKNDLTKNYLALASKRSMEVITMHSVVSISYESQKFILDVEQMDYDGAVVCSKVYSCDYLFLAAGAAGTAKLMMTARKTGSLPDLNENIGTMVGDNGDQLTVRSSSRENESKQAAGIFSSVFVDEEHYLPTRTEPIWVPSTGLPFQIPVLVQLNMTVDWENRAEWTMNGDTPELNIKSSMFRESARSALYVQNKVLEVLSDGSIGMDISLNSGVPVSAGTAHLLGGMPIGLATDMNGKVHGYPNLFVVDGSLIPGNACGANPSLAILGLAERVMDQFEKSA
ncbi:MAG: GMC oxidoreductase [Mycobacteriaceae bacterium]